MWHRLPLHLFIGGEIDTPVDRMCVCTYAYSCGREYAFVVCKRVSKRVDYTHAHTHICVCGVQESERVCDF